ncbi:MAG: phospholipid carrier-dependent glycosyltransferase [Ruminococcus sp.]|nr:phospholipid carrier-dependent glycosyltransferase [Ruminococcus sp.]
MVSSKRFNSFHGRVGKLYDLLGRHPFSVSFGLIILLTPLCFGAQGNITDSAKMIWCLTGVAMPVSVILWLYKLRILNKAAAIVTVAVLVLSGGLASSYFIDSERASLWIFFYMFLAIVVFRFLTLSDKERSDKHNAFMIMAFSFAIKFCYVLYTSCYTRQNDVGSFDGDKGHAAYIEYLIQNKHLPDFNPTDRWQFYHPPLHHTVSACWIDICENVLGASRNHARESLQMLMMFYSLACVIIVYKLLRHFGFSGKSLLIPLALFAFHPAFILSSGAINNDQLAAFMTVLTMLFTVRWFKEPTVKKIIPIAFSIGCGMMAKLNAGMIAPAVAVLFFWQLIRYRAEIKRILLQYVVFGAICFPLGLWWTIKNKIQWGVPFDYVPYVGGDQFINKEIFERLFDLSPKQFSPVFENWIRDGSEFTEYNPNVAILKNSIFGEDINKTNFPGGNTIIPTILFWVALVLALLGVFFIVYFLFKKNTKLEKPYKVFFAVYWAFSLYYFYVFCYTYTATCTMNFRYLTPILVVSVMQYAMLYDQLGRGETTTAKKVISRIFTCMIAAFCLLSVVTYLLVGYMEVN